MTGGRRGRTRRRGPHGDVRPSGPAQRADLRHVRRPLRRLRAGRLRRRDPGARGAGAGGRAFAAGTDIAAFREFTDGADGVAYEERITRVVNRLEERRPSPRWRSSTATASGRARPRGGLRPADRHPAVSLRGPDRAHPRQLPVDELDLRRRGQARRLAHPRPAAAGPAAGRRAGGRGGVRGRDLRRRGRSMRLVQEVLDTLLAPRAADDVGQQGRGRPAATAVAARRRRPRVVPPSAARTSAGRWRLRIGRAAPPGTGHERPRSRRPRARPAAPAAASSRWSGPSTSSS